MVDWETYYTSNIHVEIRPYAQLTRLTTPLCILGLLWFLLTTKFYVHLESSLRCSWFPHTAHSHIDIQTRGLFFSTSDPSLYIPWPRSYSGTEWEKSPTSADTVVSCDQQLRTDTVSGMV